MPQLKHLLSKESMNALRAHQALEQDPSVVDNMTRSDLYTHLALIERMGASEEEILSKIERWADMRDVDKLFRKARRNVRANA